MPEIFIQVSGPGGEPKTKASCKYYQGAPKVEQNRCERVALHTAMDAFMMTEEYRLMAEMESGSITIRIDRKVV